MSETALRKFMFIWLLAIAPLAIWAFPAWGDDRIQITVDLFHFSGNISEQQRADLLASPDWEIRGSYAPSIAIPGITAHWETCGFWSTTCLVDTYEDLYVVPAEIKRQGAQLQFSLPRRLSPLYKIEDVRIRQPFSRAIDVDMQIHLSDDGVETSPVVFEAKTFLLAGTLTMRGGRFTEPFYCPSKYCWGLSANGQQYTFRPAHRFAYYDKNIIYYDNHVDAQKLPEPLPDELRDKKIYRALMYTMQVDSHRIDYVEVEGRVDGPCHSYRNHEYHILYVDGTPIKYASMIPDADASRCKDHRVEMEWGNDGNVISATGKYFEEINGRSVWSDMSTGECTTDNGYSSGRYLDWNVSCAGSDAGSRHTCKTAPPTADKIQQVKSDAQRVRGWFVSDKPGAGYKGRSGAPISPYCSQQPK